MNITRPIIWFDFEATGTNPYEDRIVQIAAVKMFPDGSRETKNLFIKPLIPMSEGAMEVTGITNEDLADKQPFSRYAKGIAKFFEGCDLAGQNIKNYDLPLLVTELGRNGIEFDWRSPQLFDTLRVEAELFPRDLGTLHKKYTGEELEGAHDALNDVEANIKVGYGQLGVMDSADLERAFEISGFDDTTVDLAGKLKRNEDGVVVYNFGNDKGLSVKENPGLGEWALRKDFPEDTKDCIRELIY